MSALLNILPQDDDDDDSTFVTASGELEIEEISMNGEEHFDLQLLNEDGIQHLDAISNRSDDSSGSILSVYSMQVPHEINHG